MVVEVNGGGDWWWLLLGTEPKILLDRRANITYRENFEFFFSCNTRGFFLFFRLREATTATGWHPGCLGDDADREWWWWTGWYWKEEVTFIHSFLFLFFSVRTANCLIFVNFLINILT